MSVQNPERVVTKQDLADFYEQILPYLGGMPEILANKFSKGDMYSTDERMIGQWIDGKPLYQKTVNATISSTSKIDSTQNNFYQGNFSLSSEIPDIEMAMVDTANSYYRIGTSTRGFISLWYEADTGNILFSTLYERTNVSATFTIQYTKTTDSTISIGEETDYSTTEKIVGTWIDGRPVWQKTIDIGALPNKTAKTVAHNISNLGVVCNIYGIMVGANIYQPLPVLNDATPNKSAAVWCDDTNINVRATNEDYSALNGYITIQYVKATS